MIIFETTHIKLGGEMTPRPIDAFLILYESPDKGRVTSHLVQMKKHIETDYDGNEMTRWERLGAMPTGSRQYAEDQFTGKILEKLHTDYMAELQAANPDVGFIQTIINE
jgi:hypothetical protein